MWFLTFANFSHLARCFGSERISVFGTDLTSDPAKNWPKGPVLQIHISSCTSSPLSTIDWRTAKPVTRSLSSACPCVTLLRTQVVQAHMLEAGGRGQAFCLVWGHILSEIGQGVLCVKLGGAGPFDNGPSTTDMWHMTYDTWQVTYNRWQVTGDILWGLNILSKFQLHSSYSNLQ